MDEQRVRKIVREELTKAVSVRDVLRRDGEMNVDGGAALGAVTNTTGASDALGARRWQKYELRRS